MRTWLQYLAAVLGWLLLANASQAEEMRAAWVASVYNINFPSKPGLSADAQKAQILAILETARHARLNALMVQVRPECDALYESGIEPWSRFLTGAQGRSPGYDPLAFFIAEGRKRGIAIHAWINPYRAATHASDQRSSRHVANRLPAATRRVGGQLWLDPGSTAVQDHVVAVVHDLVRRYPVAGVHLDDYFYPYPDTYSGSFPDADLYARYQASGGRLSRADWRRNNVNTMVRRLQATVHSARPGAVFGISPFGIYTKGQPPEVKAGLDQLNELYSDPVAWLQQGWVDYLAPQLYWKDSSPQSFSALLRWWRNPGINPHGIPIYPGIRIEALSAPYNWPAGEIARQLALERTIGPRKAGGFVLWDFTPLRKNTKDVVGIVRGN
ncbi:MAG: family 10 glycosylhydrolase [Terrimicrobiaceae bacterium]|nr:family 10 glycosylhydrolase [Terrimicrobiaceae bacterium]